MSNSRITVAVVAVFFSTVLVARAANWTNSASGFWQDAVNWDHIPSGRKVPCNESSMWGDYHLLELGVYLQRLIEPGKPYLTFFDVK